MGRNMNINFRGNVKFGQAYFDYSANAGSTFTYDSAIDAYFTYSAVVKEDSVFTDTSKTTAATDGDPVRALVERNTGEDLLWASSDDRLQWEFETPPLYKSPDGDYPHIFIPNVLDTIYKGASTSLGHTTPCTLVSIVRIREAVDDEGYGFGFTDRSADRYRLDGPTDSVELSAASGIANYHEYACMWVEVNGASSRLYINNVQVGSDITLSAGTYNVLQYGTISHIGEHDLFAAYFNDGILSTGDRNAVYALMDAVWGFGNTTTKPFGDDITIAFDNTDTFNVTVGTDNNGASGYTYQWYITDTSDGGLDGKKPIRGATASSLKRSDYPYHFSGSPTNATSIVWCRVTAGNADAWAGVSTRGNGILNNIAGTPDANLPPVPTACTVANDTVTITFTGTALNTGVTPAASAFGGSGSVSGANTCTNVVVAASTVTLTFASAFDRGDGYPSITYDVPGSNALVDTNGETVESFDLSHNYTPIITNSSDGTVLIKHNLTWFVDESTDPNWNNDSFNNNATGSVNANLIDSNGVATGVSATCTDAGTGWTADGGTDALPSSDWFANVMERGFGVWNGSDGTTAIQYSGFVASSSVTVKILAYKEGGATDVDFVFTGATTTNVLAQNTQDPVEIERTFNVDGSGNFTITMTSNTGGDGTAMLSGVRITGEI